MHFFPHAGSSEGNNELDASQFYTLIESATGLGKHTARELFVSFGHRDVSDGGEMDRIDTRRFLLGSALADEVMASTKEQLVSFIFRAYDTDGDGVIETLPQPASSPRHSQEAALPSRCFVHLHPTHAAFFAPYLAVAVKAGL